MMTSGMVGGMAWASALSVLLLLGFAYIIWILAGKETGTNKSIGQVVAALIALVAFVILFYGTIYAGVMGRGAWCDNYQSGRGWKNFNKSMHEKMEKYMENKMMEAE